jgi:hypothetical protein
MTQSAPKVILMGPPGTGKSYSLHTLLAQGVEVFIIATEPNAVDTVLDACKVHNVDTSKLHWKEILPIPAGWNTLADMVKQVNLLSYDDLSKMKAGVSKSESGKSAATLVQTLANFTCDHCGQSFGDCEKWDTSRALVIDSLSGLNDISMLCHIGMKPTAHQGEWGVAMNLEDQIIKSLTRLTCYFILLAHVDRDSNVVTQTTTISPAALGNKLGPKIGRNFSEVVLTKRLKDKFIWSTSEIGTDVKNRALPISDSLEPSFKLIVDAHKRRQSQLVSPQSADASKPAA